MPATRRRRRRRRSSSSSSYSLSSEEDGDDDSDDSDDDSDDGDGEGSGLLKDKNKHITLHSHTCNDDGHAPEYANSNKLNRAHDAHHWRSNYRWPARKPVSQLAKAARGIRALAAFVAPSLGPLARDAAVVDAVGTVLFTAFGARLLAAVETSGDAAITSLENNQASAAFVKIVRKTAQEHADRYGDGSKGIVTFVAAAVECAARRIEGTNQTNAHAAVAHAMAGVAANEVNDALREACRRHAPMSPQIPKDDWQTARRRYVEASALCLGHTLLAGKLAPAVQKRLAALACTFLGRTYAAAAAKTSDARVADARFQRAVRDAPTVDPISLFGAADISASHCRGGVVVHAGLRAGKRRHDATSRVLVLDAPLVPRRGARGATTTSSADGAGIAVASGEQRHEAMVVLPMRQLHAVTQALRGLGVTLVLCTCALAEAEAEALASAGVSAAALVPERDASRVARASGGGACCVSEPLTEQLVASEAFARSLCRVAGWAQGEPARLAGHAVPLEVDEDPLWPDSATSTRRAHAIWLHFDDDTSNREVDTKLGRGDLVQLQDLRSSEHLNGRLASVVGAVDGERVGVQLLSRALSDGDSRRLSVKRDNLRAFHGDSIAEGKNPALALVVCAPSEALATQYGRAILAILRTMSASLADEDGELFQLCGGAGAPELAAAALLEAAPVASTWAVQVARESFVAGLRAVPRAIARGLAATVTPNERGSLRMATSWLAECMDHDGGMAPIVDEAAPAAAYRSGVLEMAGIRCTYATPLMNRGGVGVSNAISAGVLAATNERIAALFASVLTTVSILRVQGIHGCVRRSKKEEEEEQEEEEGDS